MDFLETNIDLSGSVGKIIGLLKLGETYGEVLTGLILILIITFLIQGVLNSKSKGFSFLVSLLMTLVLAYFGVVYFITNYLVVWIGILGALGIMFLMIIVFFLFFKKTLKKSSGKINSLSRTLKKIENV
jgi:hypothetical protein